MSKEHPPDPSRIEVLRDEIESDLAVLRQVTDSAGPTLDMIASKLGWKLDRTEDVIEPVEKVLFMFASKTLNTGTKVYKSPGVGLLIDLKHSQLRSVSFDINTGWDWGSATWGTEYPTNTNLVPVLIETQS